MPSTDISSMSVEKRFDAMVDAYRDWNTVEIPVKVDIKSPAKFSLSGRMYMKNRCFIQLSMRMLGFEVASMYMDNDSIYCVDKVHKIAVVEGMDKVKVQTGLDIAQLQSLLLGRVFVPGDDSKLSRKSKGVTINEKVVSPTSGWS